jgi:hypothetical protein
VIDDDPDDVVTIEDLAPAVVEAVIARINVSTNFTHLVYRESELDALWSLADMAARRAAPGADRLVELLWAAHDLVGEGRREAAVVELRKVISQLEAKSEQPVFR